MLTKSKILKSYVDNLFGKFKVGVCLPAGPRVTDEDVRYIFGSFIWEKRFFENLPSIVFKTLSVPLTGDRNLPYP